MIKKLIKKILGSEAAKGSTASAKGGSESKGKKPSNRRPRARRDADAASGDASATSADGEKRKRSRRRRPRRKPAGESQTAEKTATSPGRSRPARQSGKREDTAENAEGKPRRRRRSRGGGRRKPRTDADRPVRSDRANESVNDSVAEEIRAATAEIREAQMGATQLTEPEPREPETPVASETASSTETPEVTETRQAARPASAVAIPEVSPDNEFIDLGLEPHLAAAVEEKGYQLPTPIQSEAIPVVLQGRDVVGSAQTGTGKTAAFALPILQLLKHTGRLRCLVLGPTRELAQQVGEAFEAYGKYTDLKSTIVYGGVGYGPQREAFARGVDIIVATPGRLLDLLSQKALSLDSIEYLVLDEVDRMLDMGFLPDVKRIIQQCPKKRQTLFFSATIPPELEKFTEWCLTDPHTIEIGRRQSAAETVNHAFYPVVESQKFDLLLALLDRTQWESVLIFTRTKHGADFVASRLLARNHKVAAMHSNRTQRERAEALAGFKSGKYEVMVATDVAARGLDIRGVTHVINFDTPLHPEDYVHRIGRTGRAQTEGDAFTLLTEDELKYAAAIERFIGQKIERKKIDNFDYKYSAIFESFDGEPDNVFRSRLFRGSRTRR